MKGIPQIVGLALLALGGVCPGALADPAAAPAIANPPAGHEQTRAEAETEAGKLFDRLDANHDGKLDAADRTARIDAMFDKLDTNHDGMISRDEFRAAHQHPGGFGGGQWGEAARDGSPAGAAQASGERVDQRYGQHWAAGEAGHHGWQAVRDHHGHHGGGEHGGFARLGAVLHRADPNHSGGVSRAAFISAALALFDEADVNHDGKLSGEERAVERARLAYRMHMAMRGRWHAMRNHNDPSTAPVASAPPPAG